MRQWHRYQSIQWLRNFCQGYWMPIVLGIVSTVAVLGLWQQLLVQEQLHVQQLVHHEANAIKSELSQELSRRILVLEQMANRWQVSEGTPKAFWEADAANYVKDFYGYQAIEWVDPSFHVRWVVPLKGNEAAQNLDLSQEPRRQLTLSIARDLRQTIATPTIFLAQGGRGFLACIPLFVKDRASAFPADRFDGFIVGVFQFKLLFDSILKTSPWYQVKIYDGNALIYSQGILSAALQPETSVVQAYSADWQVQVFPTPELIAAKRSPLPTLVLWGGLVAAWTLAFIVYLGQRAENQTRRARKINQQLQEKIVEHQQIEIELRRSEASNRNLSDRLELAVQSAQIGIWDWDIINDCLIWNDQMYALYGVKPSDFLGAYQAWASALHPDDFEMTTAAIQQAIRGERDYEPEFRVVHPDGSIRYIQAHAVAQRDSCGQAQRMIGVNFDITERKQAEIALRESETKYRQLIDHMNAGFVVHAPDTHILQCNATACDLLGLSMDQMLGKVALDPAWHFVRENGTIMPVEEYPVNRVLSTQVPLENYVLGINRGTQSKVWVLVTAFPEFDANDLLRQVVVTFIDISELKQAETQQREMAAVMENAVSGISKLDSQGCYVYVNKAYADITGYQPEEMKGMGWQQTVHPGDLELLRSAYQRMVQDGKVELEAKGIRKDGSTFYKQLVMISAYDEQQQFIGHYCFVKDISDRKATEDALRQSESTLRSFFNSGAMLMGIVELHDNDILHLSGNQAAASFFGTTSEAMQNRFACEMGVPEQHLQQWISAYREAERTQAPVHFEYDRQTPTGQLWLAASVCQIASEFSQYPRFSYIVQDITQRKQTELALEKELLRSQALFNISIDGVVVMNHQGNVVQTSPSFAQMIGYSVEETLTLHVADWDAQWSREELQQIIQDGSILPPVFETRHRRKDGSLYDVEISYSRLEIEGEMMHFCICRDISDRKEAEEKLQKSEAALAEAQRMVHLGNWELDVATKQITWSDEMFCLFGFDLNAPEPAYAEHFNNIHPDDRIRLQQSLYLAMTEGIPYEIELRCFRTDGTIGYMEARGEAKYNNQGQIVKLFGTALDITARKQAEIALQQSEEKFRMAIDFTYNWEYWQAPDGSFVYVSPSCERITGYSPSEFIQDPDLIKNIIHPDDYSIFHHHICDDVSETGFIEFRIVTRSGAIRWMAHICQPVFNREGQYLGKRASNQDVTERVRLEAERQQAQQALRKSEARFQAFMNHSPASAWMTDLDGTILYASQTYLGTFQLPTTDLIGKSIFELYPVEVAQQFLENIHTVAKTQQVLEAIEVAPRPNGTMGDFLVYKFPIPDPSGQTLIGGVAIDVTQQHQAEEELRHQKEMFQAIVNHIPMMIALFNNQGHFEFINPELERVLGWSLEEWQQRNVFVDCYPDPTYRQSVLEHMLAATGNWKDVTTLNANGQSLETSWANVPLSGGHFLGIGQDISDRKHKEIALRQAMEAAEAANLAKSMFLANMSHELRTPLNVILGFTQVMAHGSSLTPSQKEDLQTIRRSGDHLLSLINDVLDLSKIEAGHCILENTGFDLISLLHTLRTMMSERAKAKQLQLTFDIDPEVPQFAIADQQKLRQVLLNLLSNAFKFTKQGSVTLQVTSQKPRDKISSALSTPENESYLKNFVPKPFYTLQFEVIDTGVGIAAKEQDTIFDAFVQAEAGRKSMSGTGLGLTISRKLVELMNGKIFVQSIPNVGSTFTVIVPVEPTSGIDIQPEQRDRTVIGLVAGQPHRRILVVDDQRENRLLMVRLLTQLGLEVREATNGQEAIHIWQEWQPDLTWMDIRMPGLDGYEATKQIRAMEQEKASIIIALTAQASQSDRTLALTAGCNDYISKPFQEETVFFKMAEYLGLEYLYAEPSALAGTPTSASDTAQCQPSDLFDPKSLTLPDLSTLPPTWLKDVEEAAICGDDRMIVNLLEQLPPEFTQLKTYITELANQFQFEQILDLLESKFLL